MKTKLESVVDFSTGLIVSRKSEKKGKQNYQVINLKSVDNRGYLKRNQLDILRTSKDITKYKVQKEDIIMKLVPPFTTMKINKENEDLVLSHHFVKLTISENMKKKILPEFLAWFIHTKQDKAFFNILEHGVAIRRIPISKLKNMIVKFIPLKKQKLIANLFQLSLKEKKIMEKLIKLRKTQINIVSQKILQGEL